MYSPVDIQVTRREVLEGLALLAGAACLGGCQAGRTSGVVTLPPDVWPDPKGVPANVNTDPVVRQAAKSTGLPEGVISRASWTRAKPNFAHSKPMNGVQRITVHHSAIVSSGVLGKADVVGQLESIRRNHTGRTDPSNGSHWVDIGYHYIIDPAGRVWEGRPVTIEGAHVSKTNDHNLGIMLLGNFNQHRPTNAALLKLDEFVGGLMKRYRVPVRSVYTHKELKPTECPGYYLQQYMESTRRASGRMTLASRA
jgi:hypothetical protein